MGKRLTKKFAIPVNIGVANAEGALLGKVRPDHVHNHPAGLGVDLHHDEEHGEPEHDATVSKKRAHYMAWRAGHALTIQVYGTEYQMVAVKFDKSLYDHIIAIYFAITIQQENGGGPYLCTLDLYDLTAAATVAGSEVSDTLAAWAIGRLKSGDIKAAIAAAEHDFYVRAKVAVGGKVNPYIAQLIVEVEE